MENLQIIILSIIQGLTEFLPVSSSGHLVLARHWIGLGEAGVAFDVLLHLGATVAEGRWFIDFRYSWGLTKQVVDNTTFRVEKSAEDVEEGLDDFEDGNKTRGFHLGFGYRF